MDCCNIATSWVGEEICGLIRNALEGREKGREVRR